MLAYCAEHINSADEGATKPGHSATNQFELYYVALTIRHGDRSAIHAMPGSLPYFDPDSIDSKNLDVQQGKKKSRKSSIKHPIYGRDYLDNNALTYLPYLSSFDIKPLSDNAVKEGSSSLQQSAIDALKSSLDPTVVFQIPDMRLKPGLLTTRGFMQHISLGKSLAKSYLRLLQGVHSAQNIYIRSTNYARTIQSVAALVIGMIPDIGGASESKRQMVDSGLDRDSFHRGKVVIESYMEEDQEVMHGIGLKLSSHSVDASGERVIMGACNKSIKLAKAQKDAFTISPSVISSLETLFTPSADRGFARGKTRSASEEDNSGGSAGSIRDRFVTDLADASIPHLCHNEELPCSSQGAGCMTEDLLGQLMGQADRAFCDRYTGSKGGAEATKLSIYPFLNEIVTNLQAQAAAFDGTPDAESTNGSSGGTQGKKKLSTSSGGDERRFPTEKELKESQRVKMSIFSGHDTVIAPVLAGLGAYNGKDCVWPPYASRIAFELWRPKLIPASGTLRPSDWYVRVVFNGKEITSLIPSCIAERSQKGNKSTSKTKMCSLDALSGQVQELLGSAKSIQDACQK